MSNDFSVILITPPRSQKNDMRDLRDDILDNNGVGYLTSVLKNNNYIVENINADVLNLSIDQLVQILMRKKKASLIGLSVVENNIEVATELINKLEKAQYDVPIVLGGFFPTLNYEEIMFKLSSVSYCIVGEGENTLLQLVESLSKRKSIEHIAGLVYRKNDEIIYNKQIEVDIDKIPRPSREMMPYIIERGGSGYIFSSRGCYNNCSFCSIKAFYNYMRHKPWRCMSVTRIVDEIEELTNDWKQCYIPIWDDNFLSGISGKKRAEEFIKEIKKRKINTSFFINCRVDDVDLVLFKHLKEVGVCQVGLGIENMVDSQLKLYGKSTNVKKVHEAIKILDDLNIKTYQSFIIFNPFTTIEDIEENLKYFISRLDKEKGSSFRNLLLPTVSVLGISKGIKLLDNEDIKKVVIKKGYHYDYKILDDRVELLKRIVLYLSEQWWPLYITLMNLEHYIFSPSYSAFLGRYTDGMCKEYEELWKELASLHLFTYKKLLNDFNNSYTCIEICVDFINKLNFIINKINLFINENDLKKYFMKFQYYIFPEDDAYILYDICKSEFVKITEIEKIIVENCNLMDNKKIKDLLSTNYSEKMINESFVKTNRLLKRNDTFNNLFELSNIDLRIFKRKIKILYSL